MCHMSTIDVHMSRAICHMSTIKCQESYVMSHRCNLMRANELLCHKFKSLCSHLKSFTRKKKKKKKKKKTMIVNSNSALDIQSKR